MTLVELLIIIALIGLLVGLLIPAVQSARQTALRVQCSNNLRQIAMGLHSYNDKHQVFPQGSNGLGYSFYVMLLPEIEQTSLYNSLNLSFLAPVTTLSLAPNLTSVSTELSVFVCPSDLISQTGNYGRTSYGGNGGYEHLVPGCEGLFSDPYTNAPYIGYQSILDGTSQTAAIAEWSANSGYSGGKSPADTTYNLEFPVPSFNTFVNFCMSADRNHTQTLYAKRSRWVCSGFGETLLNLILPPGQANCLDQGSVYKGIFTANSSHPFGANVVFVDGHVAFTRSTIDQYTWRALGTRSGAEIITNSDY